MNEKIKKILFSKLFLSFMLFFLIKPACLSGMAELSSIERIYDYFRILSFLFCFFIYIIYNRKISVTLLGFLFFFGMNILSNYLNYSLSSFYLNNYLIIFALIFLIETGIRVHKKNMLASINFVLSLYVIINFITIVAFPDGMYMNRLFYKENYFLGYDNELITYILPALCINYIYNRIILKKITLNYLLTNLCAILSILISWSATGVVGMMLYLAFLFFKDRKIYSVISGKKYLLVTLALFLLIVVFRFQNIFSFLVVDILHKDLTFTGRTLIWDNALTLIKLNPLFGYGENIQILVGGNIYNHAHNLYYNFILHGGIISLGLFLFTLVSNVFKLDKINNESSQTIIAFIFIFSILFIFEAYNTYYLLFIILSLCVMRKDDDICQGQIKV